MTNHASDVDRSTAVPITASAAPLYEAALAAAAEPIFIASIDEHTGGGRLVFVNEAFEAVTGFAAAQVVGRSPYSLLPVADAAEDLIAASWSDGRVHEVLLRHADGHPFWAEVAVRRIGSDESHALGTIHDVDERRRASEELAHAATHDPLTGLPNRALLLDRLASALRRSPAPPFGVAVLFVDLDHFKRVNDSLGHGCGDVVLCETARRILSCIGPNDTVGRFGGDELVIVHEATADGSENTVGAQVLSALAEPMQVGGRELVVTASIGVASSTGGASSPDQLVRDADTALYAAKQRGRARLERFTDELYERVANRVRIESELHVALRESELYVDYQPQVDLATGRLVGVEALVRWRHPRRGVVPPVEFIGVAEECGLIVPVGRFVLETACRQFEAWRRALADPPPSLTVNVSLLQLDDPAFVDDVAGIVAASGIEPSSLCLELTESAVMSSGAETVAALGRLRDLGVYVAIDDFGTEYSSLARLRDLPVEVLKIDRSFVDGLGREQGDTAIVSSILSLAFAMGLHVIAEGVETAAQATILGDLGCRVAQGFLFSRPVAAERIAELTRLRLWRAAEMPIVAPSVPRRRGRRYFVDEFLDHVGAPMEGVGAADAS